MKKIFKGAFMPHPPLIVPEVGGKEREKVHETIASMDKVSKQIVSSGIENIVIISPHGVGFSDAISIVNDDVLYGDMSDFGIQNCSLEFAVNQNIANKIFIKSTKKDVPIVMIDEDIKKRFLNNNDVKLDSGAFVPMYYLSKHGFSGKIVHICPGLVSFKDAKVFGDVLKEVFLEGEEKFFILASGDLSHYLKDKPPYGVRKEGLEFDKIVVESIKKNDLNKLITLDRNFIEKAGECGLRSLIMIMSAFKDGNSIFHSYEDFFGVGYAVATWELSEKALPVRIAQWTLEKYFAKSKEEEMPVWAKKLNSKSGVFVSLKKNNMLRGCIGTFLPQKEFVYEEIYNNTLAAAFEDPRFPPVTKEELKDIDISVDILSKPEKITSIDELDVKKYGVIVSKGFKRGLLLPDLEGVETVEEQLDIAAQKAGLELDNTVDIYKFTVTRYE